ncbi:hypothetical protein [Streptomyces syringium]|uniref:hypothetical protein n=1 Tax=Streptomyces syringium TaxID=76729 RepID=UPI003AACA0FA
MDTTDNVFQGELRAMLRAHTALAALTEPERLRALAWLIAAFDLSIPMALREAEAQGLIAPAAS